MTSIKGQFLSVVLLALALLAPSSSYAQDVTTYPSYKDAAEALFNAVKSDDKGTLRAMLGPDAENLLSSGDATEDQRERKSFLENYQKAHAFQRPSAEEAVLTVGSSAWPLPFPIVRSNERWHFDAKEGAQELVYRRIGHNELDTIKVLKALDQAQKQYAAKGHDGSPAGSFAARLVSSPGKQDGLYWETKAGEPESPAGPLVAEATEQGYFQGGEHKRQPFHGYFYHVLQEQGPHASGGAKSYEKDGRMTGFAILAYPAEYGASGVMTFLLGPRGTIYQKDMGQDSDNTSSKITAYDPDKSWKLVP
jgi:hypothetical protein